MVAHATHVIALPKDEEVVQPKKALSNQFGSQNYKLLLLLDLYQSGSR